jgi:hypothetical protein
MDKPKQLSISTLRAMAKQGIGHSKLIDNCFGLSILAHHLWFINLIFV